MLLNYSYNSSVSSLADETNITDAGYNDTTTQMPDQVEDVRWHWNSTGLWLTILITFFIILVLVNILLHIKSARAVKRSLCDLFDDVIFMVFGIYVAARNLQTYNDIEREGNVEENVNSEEKSVFDVNRYFKTMNESENGEMLLLSELHNHSRETDHFSGS